MIRDLVLIVGAGIIVGACSPVAPSVSKMSNAAAQKTTPTDGGNAPSNSTTPQNAAASRTATSAGQSTAMESVVLPAAGFSRQWTRIRAMHAAFELDGATIDELLKQYKASFTMSDGRIKGHETDLVKGKTRIYVTVDTDNANITALRLNEVPISVEFKPASDGDTDHWIASVDQPKIRGSDPVFDLNEADRILNDFQKHVQKVFVEFQP